MTAAVARRPTDTTLATVLLLLVPTAFVALRSPLVPLARRFPSGSSVHRGASARHDRASA